MKGSDMKWRQNLNSKIKESQFCVKYMPLHYCLILVCVLCIFRLMLGYSFSCMFFGLVKNLVETTYFNKSWRLFVYWMFETLMARREGGRKVWQHRKYLWLTGLTPFARLPLLTLFPAFYLSISKRLWCCRMTFYVFYVDRCTLQNLSIYCIFFSNHFQWIL